MVKVLGNVIATLFTVPLEDGSAQAVPERGALIVDLSNLM
jgi:hypothetical protein